MNRSAWPAWVGFRYLRARRENRFVGFVSGIAMTGIALGVATLLAVLSVMNGFERDLQRRILDVVSHATIEGENGRLTDWRDAARRTGAAPGVVALAPFVAGRGMLVAGERSFAVEVHGVEPVAERRVSRVEQYLTGRGLDELRPGAWRMLIGRGLAGNLGVAAGDTVQLVIAEGSVTPAGVVPRQRRFTVAGFIDSGMYDFDQGLAFVHLEDARRLFRLGDDVTGLRYAFDDPAGAGRRVRELAESLPGNYYYISDWSRRHGTFFRSIQVTKSIMFVVLMLIVGVAAFNIISTLVMVVKEKRADIAILRTQGASPGEMLAVFVTQGSVIGVVGTALGVAFGLAIAANVTAIVGLIERVTGITFVDPRVYFISELPAEIRSADVLLVAGVALALGVLATIYPAWRAARTQPAEALRHDV